MGHYTIDKGLDLPIQGAPEPKTIHPAKRVTRVAVLADDFPGMKARMHVQEGDQVKRGQVLFEDRKQPGVMHTAPGAGKVVGIHRGERRMLLSVVIALSPEELDGGDVEKASFESFKGGDPTSLAREDVVSLLVESGLWTALRTRPFSRTPAIDSEPAAIFVTAMDSNPLAAKPEVVIAEQREAFDLGLTMLSKLTSGKTHLCIAADSNIGREVKSEVHVETFAGPHPAGTAGVHIHMVRPASRNKVVWSIHYQDVIALGKLFQTGELYLDRVISLAGPVVKQPRLVRTRVGACIDDLFEGECIAGEQRLLSGSVFNGKKSSGDVFGYLSRFHLQATALAEETERPFLGWIAPGANVFSSIPLFLSKLFGDHDVRWTTALHGSERAMVPIGMYERVMPMDILPTFLLRALIVGDVEQAEKLGALELDEEDLALCSFVCPGKHNFGPLLRQNLDRIFAEG